MKFPNLTINIGDDIITMRPIKTYKTKTQQLEQDDNKNPILIIIDKIIVLYELKHINTTSLIELKSIIPYYLSDGTTNNFRANMLYPFICINDVDNPDSGCMRKKNNSYGFVYKYKAIVNLKFDKITNWIHDEIKKNFDNCENNINATNFLKDVLPISHTTGVSSVLSRLENLLDFFIAMTSGTFTHDNIKKYIPYMNKLDPEYNNKLYNFECSTDEGYLENKLFIKLYNKYRECLKIFFNDLYNQFVTNSKIIKVEYNDYTLEDITLNDFNNLPDIKICNESRIIQSRINNTNHYIIISEKLVNMICSIETSPDSFISNFKNYLSRSPVIEQLYQNIAGWGATCKKATLSSEHVDKKPKISGGSYYNKYIKYKLKYLNLKE